MVVNIEEKKKRFFTFCVLTHKVTSTSQEAEGESLLCVTCSPEMNLSIPELWDELSAPEKQSNYHNSFTSFFPSYYFFCVFVFFFFCQKPAFFYFFFWCLRALADIADIMAC